MHAFTVCSLGGLGECSHDVVVSVQEVILVVTHGDLGAAVLGEEDGVTLLDGAWADGAVIKSATGAGCDDLAKVELVLVALGEEDAALGLGWCLSLLNEYAVHKWSKFLECNHLYGVFRKVIINKL